MAAGRSPRVLRRWGEQEERERVQPEKRVEIVCAGENSVEHAGRLELLRAHQISGRAADRPSVPHDL